MSNGGCGRVTPGPWFRRALGSCVLAALAASAGATAALAASAPPVPQPRPALRDAVSGAEMLPPGSAAPYAPSAPPGTGTPRGGEVALYLVAKLSEDGEPVDAGMTWRVFADTPDENGRLPLVATAAGGDAELRLPAGTYLVHGAFGKAGSVARVILDRDVVSHTMVLNAGGLELDAVVGQEGHPPPELVTFDVFPMGDERSPIATGLEPGVILRLPTGTYHVVSRYGSVNAVLRADLEIQPGKLTRATLHHQAAKVTMKLVSAEGGEALANTQWSILSPGGDIVVEDVGAFPSFILAEGEYAVVAKNGGNVFNATFRVEAGLDRDVEVVARETEASYGPQPAIAASVKASELPTTTSSGD